jgi:glucose/arabinose dehydrogenase
MFRFLENLNSPFGMSLVSDDFYVANTDAVLRFPYQEDQTRISAPAVEVLSLPAGPINRHWTRNIIAGRDGNKLYVTVGSNSNVAENGLEKEQGRAAIWELDLSTGRHRIFASGLRNPNGMAWEPNSGALWTVVNERDELGSDLVPDYMTSVQDGGFYGWPYSYFGQHVDERVAPQRPNLVERALKPDYALASSTVVPICQGSMKLSKNIFQPVSSLKTSASLRQPRIPPRRWFPSVNSGFLPVRSWWVSYHYRWRSWRIWKSETL